jgi:hypothetical protein
MAITGTFNGLSIVALPSDTVPGCPAYSSLELDPHEAVASNTSPFTGQQQTYDWQQSWWVGQVSLPPMSRANADVWQAFILQCRGGANAFLIGNPKAVTPRGTGRGAPLVSGAGQTGYNLVTRGWHVSSFSLLSPGDWIQIGYRMYKVLNQVNSDASGNATLAIWPNLRDQPADGAQIILSHCKGLFRLANSSGNKFSINSGNYGFSGFAVREAI